MSIIWQFFWQSIAKEEAPADSRFNTRNDTGIFELLNGLFCSGAVLISFGAILGKTTPIQLVVMSMIEPFFYWLNIFIIIFELEAVDVGKNLYIYIYI